MCGSLGIKTSSRGRGFEYYVDEGLAAPCWWQENLLLLQQHLTLHWCGAAWLHKDLSSGDTGAKPWRLETELISSLVSWYFEPSQPQRIRSGQKMVHTEVSIVRMPIQKEYGGSMPSLPEKEITICFPILHDFHKGEISRKHPSYWWWCLVSGSNGYTCKYSRLFIPLALYGYTGFKMVNNKINNAIKLYNMGENTKREHNINNQSQWFIRNI